MDPITLIVTALAAGAAQGVTDDLSAMVKDANDRLRARVKERFGRSGDAESMLARYEQAPEIWRAPLMAELTECGADGDHDLIAAAKALLDLVGEVGEAGKYTIDVREAQVVQIGDNNRQDNVINVPVNGSDTTDD